MGDNGEEAEAAVQEIQVAGPAVQAIRVVTETRNLRTQPFAIPDEMNAMGKAWQEWLEGMEREFRFFKISEAVDKKDAMIIYGGNEIPVWKRVYLIRRRVTCIQNYVRS